ncbi:T9SS type A sorting domain-containing protein [Aureisphaera galaxeae]|uniref:T9SS type A sorting domain-containing protein n=1 Tax=Aureisphaera galaxeae TaxID=1538023 RepID=UPI0023505741|nr:T9SS type A sorting domain-containing protein [Aureisphaera galaxeae]MDC8004240.1 T9SS type A sorting domain-containing protein [Aureisphaera galaxeae]
MKKLYFLLFLASSAVLNAQIVDIPDANFKNALINTDCVDTNGDDIPDSDADTNDDNEIQVSEAEAVIKLYVDFQNIASLEGIASFTNIEVLFCDFNQLTVLDVSQNPALTFLLCASNELTNLDVTQNPNLEQLWCASNNLTSLDTSQNPNLTRLSCGANNIASLDITQNPELDIVTCAANGMTSLLTQNPNLTGLYCWMNELVHLDVSQNPNLLNFSCRDNNLTGLNLANGANVNIVSMLAFGNPNLTCIQVDDETAIYPECNTDANTGWCIDDTAFYSENCTFGIGKKDALAIILYPNPAFNRLYISSLEPLQDVKVYNASGRLVMNVRKDQDEIDVSALSAGLYFVQAFNGAKTVTTRFVKR